MFLFVGYYRDILALGPGQFRDRDVVDDVWARVLLVLLAAEGQQALDEAHGERE